jgi:predicted lipid-binding transport protein (Tim44 family)
MSENFNYIDIILIAMVAGIILLRLRSILGKGAEDSILREKRTFVSDVSFEANQDSIEKQQINNKQEFDEKDFLKGASSAYEIIVNAFAKADKETLKGLVAAEVYNNFCHVIDERNKNKQINDFTFIGVKKATIENKVIDGNLYTITTRFLSEIISSVKDENNNIVEGNPELIQQVNDVWIFKKDITAEDPTWHLTEIVHNLNDQKQKG